MQRSTLTFCAVNVIVLLIRKPKTITNVTEPKFATTLWAVTYKLRRNMDAAEYKHVVLYFIFQKYISDAFGECRSTLKQELENPNNKLYVRLIEKKHHRGIRSTNHNWRLAA